MTGQALDIPPSWRDAAARIATAGHRRVLILGATDVGKSSFLSFLAAALAEEARIAVIDADVGQKDLGPPACVTLGYLHRAQALAAVAACRFAFVGDTDPLAGRGALLRGLAELAARARGRHVLVNTTGLVHGPGRALKAAEIAAAAPDLVVAIERAGELGPLLEQVWAGAVLRLPASARARRKTAGEKRAGRRRAFAAYFAAARRWELPLADRVLTDLVPGCAGPLDRPPEELRHLLCGLGDARGRGIGLGRIEALQGEAGCLVLHSPVAPARICALTLGRLLVEADGRTLGRRVVRTQCL